MEPRVRGALGIVAQLLGGILAILLAWIALEFIFLRGSTPEIENQGDLPRMIASLEKYRLGGVDQFVLIRGADSTSPLLLFLHGGPGMPAMYLAHSFQRDLEQQFVVVHWDRRGAGKSFLAGELSDSLTVRQTLRDTYELSRRLLDRFKQNRIVLVAHSWGTYLGLLAVKEHPEYYAAYVGMGQLSADSLARYIAQRRFLYNMAKAHGDFALLEWLVGGGNIREDDLFRYGGEIHSGTSLRPLLLAGLWAPEYDLFDILNVPRGSSMVARRMKDDVAAQPFEDHLLDFHIPLYFFLGRHDYTTPSLLAADYFAKLKAPLKKLRWFESSAHFPFWEEPRKFSSEMQTLQMEVHEFWMHSSQD